MVVGVVANDVALCRHAADNVRSGLNHVAHHEEGRRGIVFFQGVQNGLRIAVFVAAVEGEVDDLLAGVPYVPSVVRRQKFRSGVAHGGQALLGKGEAPVVGGGGDGGIAGSRQSGGGAPAQQAYQRQAGQKQQTENLQTFAHNVPPKQI